MSGDRQILAGQRCGKTLALSGGVELVDRLARAKRILAGLDCDCAFTFIVPNETCRRYAIERMGFDPSEVFVSERVPLESNWPMAAFDFIEPTRLTLPKADLRAWGRSPSVELMPSTRERFVLVPID